MLPKTEQESTAIVELMRGNDDELNNAVQRLPEGVVISDGIQRLTKEAEDIMFLANVIGNFIRTNNLTVRIKDKDYVIADGWQYMERFSGYHTKMVSVEDLSTDKEIKFRATAELWKDGECYDMATATCSNKESTKKDFPAYAIESMVQTRVRAKLIRGKFGFVMTANKFAATPYEEMVAAENENSRDFTTEEKDMIIEKLLPSILQRTGTLTSVQLFDTINNILTGVVNTPINELINTWEQ
jgi:hypothetical protein